MTMDEGQAGGSGADRKRGTARNVFHSHSGPEAAGCSAAWLLSLCLAKETLRLLHLHPSRSSPFLSYPLLSSAALPLSPLLFLFLFVSVPPLETPPSPPPPPPPPPPSPLLPSLPPPPPPPLPSPSQPPPHPLYVYSFICWWLIPHYRDRSTDKRTVLGNTQCAPPSCSLPVAAAVAVAAAAAAAAAAATAAAAVTSVAVVKERKEREARWRHREHNPQRHTSPRPFLPTVFVADLRPSSLYFAPFSFVFLSYIPFFSILAPAVVDVYRESRYHFLVSRSCIRSVFHPRLTPGSPPPEGATESSPLSIQLHFELRSAATARPNGSGGSSSSSRTVIALSRTRESNFHLLVAFWNPAWILRKLIRLFAFRRSRRSRRWISLRSPARLRAPSPSIRPGVPPRRVKQPAEIETVIDREPRPDRKDRERVHFHLKTVAGRWLFLVARLSRLSERRRVSVRRGRLSLDRWNARAGKSRLYLLARSV
ncbi:hypothetical protein K0M31_004897 [Melipona bicolor]|uniref:Uncharacterized protein n=1 Tax=Melipona bicolor TaxID=60889 RepID=A0AA40KN56_9HYME|nr:hypothetical protein K0M31_004897 [Melipona bicolor]